MESKMKIRYLLIPIILTLASCSSIRLTNKMSPCSSNGSCIGSVIANGIGAVVIDAVKNTPSKPELKYMPEPSKKKERCFLVSSKEQGEDIMVNKCMEQKE